MGVIRVHEFTSLDMIVDTPSWTFEFGFDPGWARPSAGSLFDESLPPARWNRAGAELYDNGVYLKLTPAS